VAIGRREHEAGPATEHQPWAARNRADRRPRELAAERHDVHTNLVVSSDIQKRAIDQVLHGLFAVPIEDLDPG
jgi:hypothetical protein